jgi:hypothetical protein
MVKIKMAFSAAMVALALGTSFAQCFNTEEQYAQKVMDMLEQCEKMKNVVPCAVGFRDDYPFQDKVLGQADDNALIELAKNVEAFIKYSSKDSIYMDGDVAKRLEESVSKVNVKQRLAGTKSLKRECVLSMKDNKKLYHGASLRVLDAGLYEEALIEVNKINPASESAVLKTSKKYATMAGKALLKYFGISLP